MKKRSKKALIFDGFNWVEEKAIKQPKKRLGKTIKVVKK